MHAFKMVLLCAAFLLYGCGGDDSVRSIGKTPPCELPLKHADGANGGYSINPVVQAVPRQFNTCAIQQIQSASASVCLDHQQVGEISAQLVLPNQTTQILDIQSASVGANCLISGRLYTLTLPLSSLQTIKGLKGDWTVRVSDNNTVSSTPVGFLVGWSMSVAGQ